MSRFASLRFACASAVASIVSVPPTIAQIQLLVDRPPPGWSVSAAPPDPAFAKLSEEQLIDRLQETESTKGPTEAVDPFWVIGGAMNLGGGAIGVPVNSPAALELVRRGARAVPALLNHLTDARPTKLVYAVPRPVAGRKDTLAFGDEYDPRVRGTPPSAAVNTGERTPLDGSGTYAFKVGELCYATLGQIVSRDLRAVRCNAEEAMMFSGPFSSNPGDWFLTINSPVVRPALAAAARADWSGIATTQHADALRADIHRPVRQEPLDRGALTRLLYYYPGAGTDAAEALLRRTLIEPVPDIPALTAGDERSVGFNWQTQVVATLAPFRSNRLQAALLDLFRRAAATATADLRAQPPRTWDPSVPSLGSDLALVCARRVIHTGHDDELKTFFAARVAAIETANRSGDPAPGRNLGAAAFVNGMQAEEIRKFMAELARPAPPSVARQNQEDSIAVAAGARVRLGPVSLARYPTAVSVTVAPVEPAPDRVFAGRLIIDEARDDVGVALWQGNAPPLASVAVGRTSEDEMSGLPKAALMAALTQASPQAKALVSLAGRVELVVPDLDPDAVVVVRDIATKFGPPLESRALRAAEVSITLHDRSTAGAADGEILKAGALLGEDLRPPNARFRAPGYEAGDVALSITDPNGRFLNVEFRDAAGQSLRYNHNGWSHSSNNQGARVDVYRLGDRIPAGTQMVVWLRTKKSFLVVPLRAANLPLPAEISGR